MKKRTTVSLEEGIIAKAHKMMEEESFGDFSGFIEQIIRERWEDTGGMHEDHRTPTPPGKPEKNVSYSKSKRTKRKAHLGPGAGN